MKKMLNRVPCYYSHISWENDKRCCFAMSGSAYVLLLLIGVLIVVTGVAIAGVRLWARLRSRATDPLSSCPVLAGKQV